jgi:ABC-2 type transport system permease protein
MNAVRFELKLILQSRLAAGALLLLVALVSLSVWSGYRAVDAQKAALARINAAHQQDLAAVSAKYGKQGDAGYAAYYTFHLTWDEPSPLAFVAFGQRDLQPYSLRIRMLGLHSQLYASETFNPELALPGRFDFAFVLIYLVPLFIIVLMHDLLTGEREAGRLNLLMSLPMRRGTLWWRRAGLRYVLVLAAVLLPLAAGLVLSRSAISHAAGIVAITVLYAAFWTGLALFAGAKARSSAVSAAVLLGLFVMLTILLPTIINSAITRLVPVKKGVELTMAQRQEVHQGWDLAKSTIMDRFFIHHPEWSGTPPVTGRFHWKWYYAMHQVGDEAVSPQANQYRESLERRERWTRNAGLLVPAAAAQAALHRLAGTDLEAQIKYQDRVAKFHAELRHFYYPFVFKEQSFGMQEFQRMPMFKPEHSGGTLLSGLLGALGLAALSMILAGCVTTRSR